jgi:hypothetical protein
MPEKQPLVPKPLLFNQFYTGFGAAGDSKTA